LAGRLEKKSALLDHGADHFPIHVPGVEEDADPDSELLGHREAPDHGGGQVGEGLERPPQLPAPPSLEREPEVVGDESLLVERMMVSMGRPL
jgi:hypothetical protein